MAKLPNSVSASESVREHGLVAAGWHRCSIDKATIEPTKKDPDNLMLVIEYQIIEGKNAGRRMWERLCIIHKSETTQQYAENDLAEIAHCVDLASVADTDDLVDKILLVRVIHKQDRRDGQLVAEVKGHKPDGEIVTDEQPASQAPAKSQPSWMK